jgi:hypothetical protein
MKATAYILAQVQFRMCTHDCTRVAELPSLIVSKAISEGGRLEPDRCCHDTQVAGAVVGALLETLLIPGLHLGKNPFRAPGCFYPGHVNGWQCVVLHA